MSLVWPPDLERRASTARARSTRWASQRIVRFALLLLLLGLIGLVVGTYNGQRPSWPAPIVFYLTALLAIVALIYAILHETKQSCLAAVLGVGAVAALRGMSYLIDGSNNGFRVAAAVGAYLIVIGLVVLVAALAFGAKLGEDSRCITQ